MTDAAKQHRTRRNRFRNLQTGQKSSYTARVAEVVAGLFEPFRKVRRQPSPYKWCRRATVAQLVAEECSNSSLSPCRPATGRRQPRRLRHEFEDAVAAAVAVAVAVAHEFESSFSHVLAGHSDSQQCADENALVVLIRERLLTNITNDACQRSRADDDDAVCWCRKPGDRNATLS
ncbi:hypothetical protein L596_000042 [Steinernema carpocapsae]|uniref:Uncharacterized protein n=1 Tax=Steinernema carpocapsae TaxID=34508 RepID=A0A4U8UGR5_STECR|nr:hypothetical protein L596_000042 [Steinernema carpocapsae]